MADEHLYIVTYDIADDRRWRAVFRLMNAYGEWLQLSVFQGRLTPRRHAEFCHRLTALLKQDEDHAMIVDAGPADRVEPRVLSLGKRRFDPVQRAAVVV